MSHHASTPKSVLDAPTRTVTVTAVPEGATRHERRHGISTVGMSKEDAAYYLRSLRRINTPFVRTTPRRGKNVRRGGLA